MLEYFDLLITSTEVAMLNGRALIAALNLSQTGRQKTRSILLTSQKDLHCKRSTDPDCIIHKDADFLDALGKAVHKLATAIQSCKEHQVEEQE